MIQRLTITPMQLQRCRTIAACLCAAASFAMLWVGLGVAGIFNLQREAVADSAIYSHQSIPPAFVPREQAALLQSSVDSAALSLGSVFAASPELFDNTEHTRQALGSALSNLTFGLGGEVYFTAWQGTRIIHSPLSPDAHGMDFSDALDERGAAFVQSIEAVAGKGGGFVQAVLPRQMAGLPESYGLGLPKKQSDTEATYDDLDVLVTNVVTQGKEPKEHSLPPAAIRADITDKAHDAAPLLQSRPTFCLISAEKPPTEVFTGASWLSGPAPLNTAPVEQIIYVQRIPHSDWHIAAFMPQSPRVAPSVPSAWKLASIGESEPMNKTYRKGLCVSGFSLAGFAGLLLLPGGRRREDEEA